MVLLALASTDTKHVTHPWLPPLYNKIDNTVSVSQYFVLRLHLNENVFIFRADVCAWCRISLRKTLSPASLQTKTTWWSNLDIPKVKNNNFGAIDSLKSDLACSL